MGRIFTLFAAALILLATGCMDYDETIEIKKNGSGRIEMRMAMDTNAFEEMKAMAAAFGTEDQNPGDISEEEVRKQLKESGSKAKLEKYKEYKKDGDTIWEMTFTFEDPSDLSGVGMGMEGGMGDAPFTWKKQSDGSWLFARLLSPASPGGMPGTGPSSDEETEEFDMEEFDPEMMAEQMKKLQEAMEGMEEGGDMGAFMESMEKFGEDMEEKEAELEKASENRRFRFEVRFPGKIVDSNATEVKGKTAIWIYKLEDMEGLGGLNGRLTATIR